MKILYFFIFWACQISSSILFKYAGIHPKQKWIFLIVGNIILLSASWVLVQLFKTVPQPIVIALCSGGTFLTVQLSMALYFKQPLSWMQILGSLVIIVGMTMVTFGGKDVAEG
ncbi:DMT family transporter [Sphingobacterium hungaricum]|uniref:Multidrug transporter EmrE n=1 Tax=Sphingobacterium hungaricum TaxID=2082723 RepID=A0A928YRP6_9SPHI|nr:hypothetical protein [Sphingobacterium hungaricum]MBE8714390.1 hypothetical protein [Sphingobacterium hungaricum]